MWKQLSFFLGGGGGGGGGGTACNSGKMVKRSAEINSRSLITSSPLMRRLPIIVLGCPLPFLTMDAVMRSVSTITLLLVYKSCFSAVQ